MTVTRRTSTAALVAVAAVGAVTLGACGAATPATPGGSGISTSTSAAGPTPTTPAPRTTTTVTVTASPTGSATPPQEGQLATFSALGPAKVGQTMDAFAQALGQPLKDVMGLDQCYTASVGTRSPVWVWLLTDKGRKGGVQTWSVAYPDEPTGAVDRTFTTREGIGLGSTEARLTQAYAGRFTTQDDVYVQGGHRYVVNDGAGHALVFRVNGAGKVTAMSGGYLPQVSYIEGCA